MGCFWGGRNNNCRRSCNNNCGCENRSCCETERDECEKERREAYCAGFRDGCNSASRWRGDDDC